MKSFKIVDTKFRILKGGKIGLATSIALIGGMLSFGSASANATDSYFTSNLATVTDHTIDATAFATAGDNYLYWSSFGNGISTVENRSSTAYNDVLFDPTSMAYSTLTAAWYSSGGDNTILQVH